MEEDLFDQLVRAVDTDLHRHDDSPREDSPPSLDNNDPHHHHQPQRVDLVHDCTEAPCLPLQEDGCLTYFVDMVRNLSEPLSIRGKQGRVTLWETMEHFDLINDFIFLYRVACTIALAANATNEGGETTSSWFGSSYESHWGHAPPAPDATAIDLSKKDEIGLVVFYWLCAIWLTSVIAYAVRSLTIYHRISKDDMGLFAPIVVFWKVRQVGDKSPENLYMFERLSWTYQVMMRIIEDIPQFVLSAVFSATYGADAYSGFMISWSAVLMILTSYRMSVMYPIVGTASLLVSRQPPIDSPHLNEAAHVTRGFAAFMIFVMLLWSFANVASLRTATGMVFLWSAATQVALFLIGLTFACYYRHLVRQASIYLEFGETLQPNSPSCDERHVHSEEAHGEHAENIELAGKNRDAYAEKASFFKNSGDYTGMSVYEEGDRHKSFTIALSAENDGDFEYDSHNVSEEFPSWGGLNFDRGIEYQKVLTPNMSNSGRPSR